MIPAHLGVGKPKIPVLMAGKAMLCKPLRVRQNQAVQGRPAELPILVALAHPRPHGVDDVAGLELAPTGHDGPADFSAADPVALSLDPVSPLAADGPGNTPSQDQLPVGGVDNGIGVLLGDVSLNQQKLGVPDSHPHGAAPFPWLGKALML